MSPGDVLNFFTPVGQTATLTNPGPDSGTIETTGGFLDVDFDEIEELNFAGSIIVDGSGEDDLLVIDATGADSGTFQLTTDVDGSGGLTATLTGVLLLRVIDNLLTQFSIGAEYRKVVTGLIIVIVVTVDVLAKKRSRK